MKPNIGSLIFTERGYLGVVLLSSVYTWFHMDTLARSDVGGAIWDLFSGANSVDDVKRMWILILRAGCWWT